MGYGSLRFTLSITIIYKSPRPSGLYTSYLNHKYSQTKTALRCRLRQQSLSALARGGGRRLAWLYQIQGGGVHELWELAVYPLYNYTL